MPGLDTQRLVLVTWTAKIVGQQNSPRPVHHVGTGYFVTANLVLTACHATPPADDTPVSVRVEETEDEEARWRKNGCVVWRDESLDAALIKFDRPLAAAAAPVHWSETLPSEDSTWHSRGYPDASIVTVPGRESERKSAGLRGTVSGGGGGQGSKELELDVKAPPPLEDWAGISGAPVFVDDALVGMVKSASFGGNRLNSVPAGALLQNVAFRRAIEPAWLEFPQSGPWLLVLLSEIGTEDIVSTIKGSLERHEEEIAGDVDVGQFLKDRGRIVAVRVTEALSTPERWLRLVEALCAAPLMIVDVTNFEPGVMMALGVRAVVRRGITIASTVNRLDEAELSALPFNIQETKLISHGDADPDITVQDPRYSLNIIAKTVLNGLRELHANPRYLDLPAYDAVRCPIPTGQQKAREAILVLCSFHKEYAPNWRNLSDGLAKHYPAKQAVRMRDIVSPRLVGQALYEYVRWTKTCVVDWTHWRANVLFEFGVRLACSSVEPVCLLEMVDDTALPAQKEALLRLFGPTRYTLPELRPALHEALATHELHKSLKEGDIAPPRALVRVPHNGTYNTSLAAFEYAQEHVTVSPHDLLRSSVEALRGKDRQQSGETPVLFASNPAFARDLRRSVRERWIAAWHYLRNRYSDDDLRNDARLYGELKRLGATLLQEVREDPGDPSIAELRSKVDALIEALPVSDDDGAGTAEK